MGNKKWIIIIASITVVVAIGLGVGLGIGLNVKTNGSIEDNGNATGEKNMINAEIYDRAVDWLQLEFIAENLTKNCVYFSKDDNVFYGDFDSPNDITYVLTSQERFKEVFKEFPQEVNFSAEIIVVYLFTDIYNGFGCEVESIELKEDLDITILHKMPQTDDPSASAPCLRCIAIKMDRITYKDIYVKYIDEPIGANKED